MKDFNLDGPVEGLFDLAAPVTSREMTFADHGPQVPVPAFLARPGVERTLRAATRTRRSAYRAIGKRVLDITLIALTLPFTLPFIALCAAALWLEGGSAFYRQDRLGYKGARFSILKLRTMVEDADQVLEQYLAADPEMRREWDELQKIKNDPRITRVGKLLRATSLDELPQLINVLKGEMSLVGPRPMLPEQRTLYGDMTHYDAVRPGITGLWQVGARNGNRFSYRNEVDADYERSLSLRNDLSILARTFGAVLRRTGC